MAKKDIKTILLEDYSFDKSSMKFVPAGGEIFRYQGCEVVYLHYTREDSEHPWNIKQKFARIISIGNYESLSGTFEASYYFPDDVTDENQDHVVYKMRIIPEGFSYENTEETNEFKRFVPLSLHFKLVELESYYNRMKELFLTRPSMSLDEIKAISTGKQEETVQYRNNIVFILDNREKGICCFRINKINTPIPGKSGETTFGVYDSDGNYFPLKTSKSGKNFFHINGESLGEWKIIDIRHE